MIVVDTGRDMTNSHTIGVSPSAGGGWYVAIDDQPFGPCLPTQREAEDVAEWLKGATPTLMRILKRPR